MAEHAVLLNVALPTSMPEGLSAALVGRLAGALSARVSATGVGEYDGEAVGEGWAIFYCYGPDADRLWGAVAEEVDLPSLPSGSYVVKRYGEPGAPEERIEA